MPTPNPASRPTPRVRSSLDREVRRLMPNIVRPRRIPSGVALLLVGGLFGGLFLASPGPRSTKVYAQAPTMPPMRARPAVAYPTPPELQDLDLSRQTAEEAARKSTSCVQCHQDSHDPHFKETV